MKFALFNKEKIEATKGAKGICPSCGSELIAKCGEVKVNHWAHKGNRNCDQWWENETEWHRSWKDKFPVTWQEKIHKDDTTGEKHIADVKTENGWVIEFQHSFLNPEERRSRNSFYRKIVWVVDGLRRATDVKQFNNAINESIVVSKTPLILQVRSPEKYRLLKEWHASNALVFFDFQEIKATKQIVLWFLFPKTKNSGTYIGHFSRTEFIGLHNNNKFSEIVKNSILPIYKTLIGNEQKIRAQIHKQRTQQSTNILTRRRWTKYRRRF